MQIPEIKTLLTIMTVLESYGYKADKNNMLRCPFHEDKTASMKIYTSTNSFHCFGCGKSGDQVEFCTLKEGNKHKGIIKATELTRNIKPENKPKERKNMPKQNPPEILTKFFTIFKNNLSHPVAQKPKEYLQERNLDYHKLEIGYNSGQFHHKGKLNDQDLQSCIDAGLLTPYSSPVPNSSGSTYKVFAKECIIFPLKNRQNQIVSLYGRSIQSAQSSQSSQSEKSGKHFYLKNRSGLYPHYPNPNTKKLILTEAIIDAATLLELKVKSEKLKVESDGNGSEFSELLENFEVLALYGTNGLTVEHIGAIKELYKLEEIIFFFDGDSAGKQATEKYSTELKELLPHVKLSSIETPENEDINSLSQSHEPGIFTHLLTNRITISEAKENESFLLNEKEEEESPVQTRHALSQQEQLNTQNPDFITYKSGQLKIIILGGINLQQLDRLRITLKISRTDTGDPLHSIRHTLDLYHSDYLEKFINKASEQLETGTNILRKALAELTEAIEQYRLKKLESLKEQKPKARELDAERTRKAIKYLSSQKLMERTCEDIGRTGMIGEENNRLLMYLVFTSRLREQPLHIISLGSSGTGKTYLQEKVSELIPEQDKLEITILSENAFYYFDRKELKNKLVLIEDMDGAQDVLYPLRELQSKKRISKTIPIKDSKGNLKTITLHVEGPICLAGTTTKERLFEDNSNRSLLIYLDESNQHKENIMQYQRKLSAGKINTKEENRLKEFFKDMQTVLKPINVRNPFAEYLKLPEYVFKPLRTNSHYLAVIEAITFYHQYQREIKTCPQSGEKYIETTLEDIKWANLLLRDVLLAKSDELSGECRSFFEKLKTWVKKENKLSFFASQVRESFRMNPSNLKYYLVQLTRYGFIKPVGGNRYKRGYEYEIINFHDYETLNNSVNSVFDDVLEKIKTKSSGQRGQLVDNCVNYPHN